MTISSVRQAEAISYKPVFYGRKSDSNANSCGSLLFQRVRVSVCLSVRPSVGRSVWYCCMNVCLHACIYGYYYLPE